MLYPCIKNKYKHCVFKAIIIFRVHGNDISSIHRSKSFYNKILNKQSINILLIRKNLKINHHLYIATNI